MSLAHERERSAAWPAWIVEMDLDYVTSATAATNPDGSPCYNTPATSAGFAPLSVGTRTRRWCARTAPLWPGLQALACVESVKLQDEQLTLGAALGKLGVATITLRDFLDDDRGEDPYYSTRVPTPAPALYFQRLLARNPYIQGRAVRIWRGYLTDGYESGNGEWLTYYAKSWARTAGGQITLEAVGPLRLVNMDQATAPAASHWRLAAALTTSSTSATLATGSYDDAHDPSTGLLRFGDEIAAFSRSGTSLTLTRAQAGTSAATADADDNLQRCTQYVDARIDDLIADLLITYAGVDAALIPTAAWAAEVDTWLSTYRISELISEPTEVVELLNDLARQVGLALWWDAAAGVIRLLALRPPIDGIAATLRDSDLLAPVQITRDLGRRISRCDVLFDRRSLADDPQSAASYRKRVIGRSIGAGAYEHGSEASALIKGRFFAADDEALALRCAYVQSAQYRDGLVRVQVDVSKRHEGIAVGDVIDLLSQDLTDATGSTPLRMRMRITAKTTLHTGHSYRLTGVPSIYGARYAVLMDASTVPADYAAATPAERDPAFFLAETTGSMPGGDLGYALA
jgi:hypothetical protein